MIYKRYLKKSGTDDDAVPSEVEEAEDQDPESDHVSPTSSRDILAQKLHDYIGKKLGEGISPENHAAAIRAILSTQVKDPVSGQMKHKYINEDMRKLFKEHPKSILPNAPSGNIAPLSHKPLTYTPTEMIGPTTSLAIMRMPNNQQGSDDVAEYEKARALELEEVQPEASTGDPDDEFDFSRSLLRDTQILDTMVKSLLRKIANGEI